ncbi:TRAP transporter substrate-binding protein DctP [Thermodesulfobacteriota bacterium]
MKRAILFVLVLLAVSGLLFSVWDQPAALAKEPIEFTMVHFGPAPFIDTVVVKKFFVNRVNEKAKGELKITVKGGPEVFPPFEQPIAVKKGLVDMCLTGYTFFATLVPGGDLFRAAEFTPKELRERGADDFFREKCAKFGLYPLGNPIPLTEKFFYILSKIKFQNKEDFKGHKIAGSPPFFAFFKSLGMVPQVMRGVKDYFPLMERGVVDAHISPLSMFLTLGTYETAKYIIDEPFFNSTSVILINLKKWQILPKHLQVLLHKIMIETETTVLQAWGEKYREDREKLKKGGIEFYKLSPDVARWYSNTAIEACWKEAEVRHPADLISGYRKYLRR